MKNDNFPIFLVCSLILHLLLMYFFLFGLPSFFSKFPEEQVITFEMLPISDKSNVPTQKKQREKAIENTDAKKVVQSKPAAQEEKKPVEKIIPEEKKPEPSKPEKKEKLVEEKKEEIKEVVAKEKPIEKKKPVEKKPEEKKKEEKKSPVKKEEKKPSEVKKKIPNKSDLDSLLKNLEESSEGNNAKSNKQARTEQSNSDQESKGPYNENLPFSISEMSLIQQQIKKHWYVPIGAQNLEQVRVALYIALNKDGSVEEVQVKEKSCNGVSSTVCQALVDSVLRAVWQASPIENLDPQRYNIWKEIISNFDPSKI